MRLRTLLLTDELGVASMCTKGASKNRIGFVLTRLIVVDCDEYLASVKVMVERADEVIDEDKGSIPICNEYSFFIFNYLQHNSNETQKVVLKFFYVCHQGDPLSIQESVSGDLTRNKTILPPSDVLAEELPAKRIRFDMPFDTAHSTQMAYDLADDNDDDGNGNYSSSISLVGNDLSPAEKMIAMIGALLAEGERGAESLELLISNIHADLMADIVIETMKHLPKNLVVASVRHNNGSSNEETSLPSISSQVLSTTTTDLSAPTSSLPSELATSSVGVNGFSVTPDVSSFSNLSSESKRDPRRDPRRLDPRRSVAFGNSHSASLNLENSHDMQPMPSQLSSKPVAISEAIKIEHSSSLGSKLDVEPSDEPVGQMIEKLQTTETLEVQDNVMIMDQSLDVHTPPNLEISPVESIEEPLAASTPSDVTANEGVVHNLSECDEFSSPDVKSLTPEDNSHDLITHPPLVELMDEQKSELHRLAVTRIVEDYKHLQVTGYGQACLPLLARLVAQVIIIHVGPFT
ncbi:hypothetical protein BHE74_00014240 [Ensete ventricosum]|uniref:Uncharacterized protein n=1 Tax=Ensete ventricosum TaxID=4639 RepID=A0A426ZPZ0_ENSVE|nr:hypothetical protein B296_00033361 [Ensete ventricosum]RWW28311.1 hypothetical protein GW17_00007219 [Ensete ventricosum]RWW77592.1 hypothetical protein BHE74_00014240 [Ensete ventricosum]RZR88635.1 hypothetical protein BHM03_00016248 [Ensete ventricosum]